ncbi:MAG: c-type cytochrome [Planctomycetes bacterium]|nr:c-type cytochrome [Planctomycetota bacterium]
MKLRIAAGVATVAFAGLVVFLWPSGPSTPGPQPLVRSERLELESVAPVESARPELAWVVPPAKPGWGEVSVPAAPDLASLRAPGAALYAARCASCHGAAGRGDGRLASELPRRPRDLRGPLRTRSTLGAVLPADLFRTLTAGAPRYGMPAFAHLPSEDRWALVAHLLSWREEGASQPVEVPPAPAVVDLHLGQDLFRSACAVCHGREGEGTPSGNLLLAGDGSPAPATDLAFGPAAFRGGSRPVDVARTLKIGRPGTSMVAFEYSDDELWALASYVAALSEAGHARRSQAWNAFFTQQSTAVVFSGTVEPLMDRWDPAPHPEFDEASEPGCLACHEGIEEIAEGPMQVAIDAFAGGDPARACVVCHQGDALAHDKRSAHRDLLSNPGSLWVTSLGLGCGRCHSDLNALGSLLGRPFPEPRGGDLLAVVARTGDPSGASGSNHAYRMQRGLMAQESGKVTLFAASVGLAPADAPRYTDFSLDDPDGPVPCSGSPAYRAFVARGVASGYVTPLAETEGLPTYDEALAKGLEPAAAGYLDYFRKDCVRCHLWGEGKPSYGEFRPSGCSACHVLTSMRSFAGTADNMIPAQRPGHTLKHRLIKASAIPESQCNHCHTRGLLTEHSEAHQQAGIGCADCHTSIDVHGDGNIYPSIEHQLEIRCEDCHGTSGSPPWELPLAAGTPAAGAGPRGVFTQGEREHVLTSRGNPRTSWLREDGHVVLESRYTGKRHVAPLLGAKDGQAAGPLDVHAQVGHEQVSCALCHSRQAEMCAPCHIRYYRDGVAQDWLLSALVHEPDGRSQKVLTSGEPDSRQMGDGGMGWVTPETRRDRAERLVPRVPGCYATLTHYEGGKRSEFVPNMNYGSKSYPPPIAPTVTHEFAIPARTCKDCHREGADKKPGK